MQEGVKSSFSDFWRGGCDAAGCEKQFFGIQEATSCAIVFHKVALYSMLRGSFARDSAHSPATASVRASRGIQHTRIGRALSGGRTESGEGECAGLSFIIIWSVGFRVKSYLLG